jgi:ribosomal protein S18 acetylase RimI-like enzyme
MTSPAVLPLTIRRLEPADADAYRAIRLEALAAFPDAFTSSVEEERPKADVWSRERLAPQEGRAMLGAFVGDTLAGTAGLMRRTRSKEHHRADFFGMYVAPAHAGRRIGRKLVDASIAEALTWPGLEHVVLSVTYSNARARRLYLDAGFITFGIEHRAIRVGDEYYDKEHMVLFLERK